MTVQTETEDQATQDNAPPTPSDTPRHPMAYSDTELDFEHDPELDMEDQNILAIESTDTFDNPIDNDPIEIKDNIPSIVGNNSLSSIQDFNRPIDFTDHNSSIVIKAETNNSHKESRPIESEDKRDSEWEFFGSESIYDLDVDLDIDSDIDSGCDSEYDFEDLEAMYLDMCEIFRAKIPASKPMPLFPFG